MSISTLRLDEETERLLESIRQTTGLSRSAVFKQGLRALARELAEQPSTQPYEVYRTLDLGPGGYAIAPSHRAKQAVREHIASKFR